MGYEMNNKNEYILRDLLEYASNKKQVNEQRVPEGVTLGDEVISVKRTTSDEGDGIAVKMAGSSIELLMATTSIVKAFLSCVKEKGDVATLLTANIVLMGELRKAAGGLGEEILKDE